MSYGRLIGLLTIAAFLTAGTAPARATETDEESQHLVPEAGIMFEPGSPYHYQQAMLRLLLAGANTPNRKCQMVLEDGFVYGRHELSVFFERGAPGEPAIVISRAAQKSIRGAVARSLYDPKRPEGASLDVKVRNDEIRRGQAALTDQTSYLLEQVCEVMLGATRYPTNPVFHNDAKAAHLAHHDLEHGYRAGKTEFHRGRVGSYV